MNPQMTFQRICAISGVICPLLFFGAFVAAGFIPLLSPSASAHQIAAHYQTHANGIRLGAGLMLLSGMFYAAFTALISAQMQRIGRVHQTVINTQMVAGAFACLTFLVPAMLFAVTAFRPERSPESTLLLNDMCWILLVMPWPPFMVQNFAFAFAIFSDKRSSPIFPRWLAYLNVWAPIIFTPAIILPFFKSGPFAWNGIFVFWIPAVVFGIQFIANSVRLLKAIKSEEAEADGSDGVGEASAHQSVTHAARGYG
jgi:hypothetical protein